MTTITHSVISGNTGGHGGGIANRAGTMAITASRISGNTAIDGAGGIDNAAALTLIDRVVTANFVIHRGVPNIDDRGTLIVSNSTITRRSKVVVSRASTE